MKFVVRIADTQLKGDSFLKLATTRVLYDDPTLDTAGKLTRERTAFIKNVNLIRCAPILELGECMNVLPLQSRKFLYSIAQWLGQVSFQMVENQRKHSRFSYLDNAIF